MWSKKLLKCIYIIFNETQVKFKAFRGFQTEGMGHCFYLKEVALLLFVSLDMP